MKKIYRSDYSGKFEIFFLREVFIIEPSKCLFRYFSFVGGNRSAKFLWADEMKHRSLWKNSRFTYDIPIFWISIGFEKKGRIEKLFSPPCEVSFKPFRTSFHSHTKVKWQICRKNLTLFQNWWAFFYIIEQIGYPSNSRRNNVSHHFDSKSFWKKKGKNID